MERAGQTWEMAAGVLCVVVSSRVGADGWTEHRVLLLDDGVTGSEGTVLAMTEDWRTPWERTFVRVA